MSPSIDPSSLNGLVQLLHHTTLSGKPTSHTFLFRSQANPLGWTVQLYEWGKDEGGTTRWKGWEGGWNGDKGLNKMVTLVPDLTGAAFVRRISNHICSGHLHVEGFKTGLEDSLKLTITDPPKTFEPFVIPMSSISSELVAQQGFDFLRDSIAFNATHRIAAIPRDATESPEIAMNDLPDAGAVIEDLKAALEREKKAHKATKAQLETLEAQEPESQKASIPVFHSRVGFSTANANVKANRPEKPVFDDDTSSDTSDAADAPPPSPKKKGSVVAQEPSGSETEPEEDDDAMMDEEFSQKTLQASSQAQPSSTFPKSPSKPPKSPSRFKAHPTSSQKLPPPTPTKAKPNSQQHKSSPVASGSKLSPSKISPRKNLLPAKDNDNDSSDDSSMEESPTLTASASKKNKDKGTIKKTGSTFIKPPPPPKRLTGRARAKKRATFGADSSSSSSSDEGPAKKKAKPSSSSNSPPVKSSSSKGKGKAKMVVEEKEKSGSETE